MKLDCWKLTLSSNQMQTSLSWAILHLCLAEKLLKNHVLSNCWCGIFRSIRQSVLRAECIVHAFYLSSALPFLKIVTVSRKCENLVVFCILASLAEEGKVPSDIRKICSNFALCLQTETEWSDKQPLVKFLYSLPSNHILLSSYKSSDYPKGRELVGFCMYLWPPYPN